MLRLTAQVPTHLYVRAVLAQPKVGHLDVPLERLAHLTFPAEHLVPALCPSPVKQPLGLLVGAGVVERALARRVVTVRGQVLRPPIHISMGEGVLRVRQGVACEPSTQVLGGLEDYPLIGVAFPAGTQFIRAVELAVKGC